MKTILITGATGNLGRAAVEKFSREGHSVIALVSPGKSLGYHTTGSVTSYEADLTDERSVDQTIATIIQNHKTIDAAILTVGGFAMGSIEHTDAAALQAMFSINFSTAYQVARPVFNHMMTNATGRIVFVGARPALQAGDGKKMLAYALSKSLIFKLSEFLNAEGSEKSVITSVIVPSTIDTPANRAAMPNADFSKWVSLDQLTASISFLLSKEADPLREPILKLYGNA